MSNDSLVQLFKARYKPGTSVKVPFPNAEEPALIFEISRMSPTDLRAAEAAALAKANEYEQGSRQWFSAYNCGKSMELTKKLKIVGWEAKQDGIPPFDQAVCKNFLDSLELGGCLVLTGLYLEALAADEAAASGNEITPGPDSGKE